MKKLILHSILSLAAAFILSFSLVAQEKTEITIQVKKDGKVVQDTTYRFDDDAEIELEKILEEHGGDDENVKVIVIKKKYKKQ